MSVPDTPAMTQTGAEADIEKYSKRTVRVTAQHNEECRRLLRLMGVPVIEVMHITSRGRGHEGDHGDKQRYYLCLLTGTSLKQAEVLRVGVAVQAPSEAEAQCAQMCKEGLVRTFFFPRSHETPDFGFFTESHLF